jgi:hypothetical protein
MTDPLALVALRALADAYAVAVDGRDEPRFRSLWEPGATLTVHDGDGPASSTYDGVDAIAGVIEAIGRYRQTMHTVGAQVVEVRGDDAAGEVTCVAHHLVGGEESTYDLVMAIRYVDRYHRGADGAWRFRRRECRKRFTARHPVESHWEPER